MELNNMKLLIFLIIHNIGLTLQQQSQSQDYYFGQPQGRFIPSTYQNSRNNYYDPATQTRNQQPGSFQEQTLFVNPGSANNGRIPIANQPQHGNQETVKPSYFQFQQFPTTHHPNFYEISPRPFSITPSGNSGFQFTRAGAVAAANAAQKNNFYQTTNYNRNVPKTQSIDSYLDDLEEVHQPQLVETYIAHRPTTQDKQLVRNLPSAASNSNNNLRNNNNYKSSSTFNDYFSSQEETSRFSNNNNNRLRTNFNSITSSAAPTTPTYRRATTTTTTTEAPIITTRRNNRYNAAVRTTILPPAPPTTYKTTRNPKTYAPRQRFTPPATQDSVESRTTLNHLSVRPLARQEPETTPRINILHNGSETLTEALNERSAESLLDQEDKNETLEQNNVLTADDVEIEYYDDDEKPAVAAELKPPQEDHTVILTDNFFLPGKPKQLVPAELKEIKDVDEEDEDSKVETVEDVDPTVESKPQEVIEEVIDVEIEKPEPTKDVPEEEEEEEEIEVLTTTTTTTTTTEIPTTKSTGEERKSIPVVEYEYEYEYEDEAPEQLSSTTSHVKSSEQVSSESPPEVTSEARTNSTTPGATVLGGSVVSVVTTKSVVNGTVMNQNNNSDSQLFAENPLGNGTTESWVVVASVQTSRSISGARFLPFPSVNQAEEKQVLKDTDDEDKDEEDDDENSFDADLILKPTTEMTNEEDSLSENVPSPSTESVVATHSTESIIDKLDRVQSELSVGVLSGKFPVLKEMTTEETESKSDALNKPPQVFIRKFTPKAAPTPKAAKTITTKASSATSVSKAPENRKILFDDVQEDEINAALLPPGFKQRHNYKLKKPITTTTTEATFQEEDDEPIKPEIMKLRNSTIGRSYKNNAPIQDIALAGLLPKGYKPPKASEKDVSDILSKIKFEDSIELSRNPAIAVNDNLSKFLPPGFKPKKTAALPVIPISDNISQFLPPGYKPPVNEDSSKKLSGIPIAADILNLLPPGYKQPAAPKENADDSIDDVSSILNKIKFKESSNLLPPGFSLNITASKEEEPHNEPNTPKPASGNSGFKVVFPSRPGAGNNSKRLTTPKPHFQGAATSSGLEFNIRKGPPNRVTTEFTGWPSPPTTPLSIEKLLEQQRAATFDISSLLSSTTPRPKTTTPPPTTTTPRPTTPGICRSECDLAGTIRIVDGVKWTPELLDHYTDEWKNLAKDVEVQLNEVYSNSRQLSRWYKKVNIDSFSKGSVLVDYFVELKNITHDVNTQQIKQMFHDALVPTILRDMTESTTEEPSEEIDVDIDYPADDTISAWKVKGRPALVLGRFVVDPISTDFLVIPKQIHPTIMPEDPNVLLPQWAIAVICIGFISLMFVIVFGVTVLVSRQKASKKKPPTPLTADMLNELNKNHMGGLENYGNEDLYNVDDTWDDNLEQGIKPKRFSSSMHGSSASNIYDSWRSQRHTGDYYYDSHDNYLSGYKTKERDRDPSFMMMHEPYPAYPSHLSHNTQQQQQQQHYNASTNSNSNRRYYKDYDPNF